MEASRKESLEKPRSASRALYRLWLLKDEPPFLLSLLRSRRQGPIAAIKSLVRDPEALTDEERRVVERKICGLFTEDEVEAVRNYRGVAFGRPPEMLALAARAPASLPNIHGLLVVPRERVRRRAVNMIPRCECRVLIVGLHLSL
jgi:hypothetical protein